MVGPSVTSLNIEWISCGQDAPLTHRFSACLVANARKKDRHPGLVPGSPEAGSAYDDCSSSLRLFREIPAQGRDDDPSACFAM